MKTKITGKDVAALMFLLHTHEEESENIVYSEERVIKLLKALDLPSPDWNKIANFTKTDFRKYEQMLLVKNN